MLMELLCTRSVMLELLWRPIPELLSVLNVDGAVVLTNRQIIQRIGLEIGLVSRGSFR